MVTNVNLNSASRTVHFVNNMYYKVEPNTPPFPQRIICICSHQQLRYYDTEHDTHPQGFIDLGEMIAVVACNAPPGESGY